MELRQAGADNLLQAIQYVHSTLSLETSKVSRRDFFFVNFWLSKHLNGAISEDEPSSASSSCFVWQGGWAAPFFIRLPFLPSTPNYPIIWVLGRYWAGLNETGRWYVFIQKIKLWHVRQRSLPKNCSSTGSILRLEATQYHEKSNNPYKKIPYFWLKHHKGMKRNLFVDLFLPMTSSYSAK